MNHNYAITQVAGGICAPLGFKAASVHAGIRMNRSKDDLALIVSDAPASAAAVYTQNLVKGAPIGVTQANLAATSGIAQAVICNSGNANTCNADGEQIARGMCEAAGGSLGIAPESVIVASTGVIGAPLALEPIAAKVPELVAGLSAEASASTAAAKAIMTTDTLPKEAAVSFELPSAPGVTCHLGAIAKGSGMIHPDLATMLVFITTDAAISPQMLELALRGDVQGTFNMTSVDGDTSTNDMVSILANGLAGNPEITSEGADFEAFMAALNTVTIALCKMIAGDGEGATKLLECQVSGALDETAARTAAKAVICSSLVKTAMFGADANWGRVLCALGYSGAKLDPNAVNVSFLSPAGVVAVCENGAGIEFNEELAKQILSEDEITIKVDLGDGEAAATAWGCDLTYEYVKINGDYRT